MYTNGWKVVKCSISYSRSCFTSIFEHNDFDWFKLDYQLLNAIQNHSLWNICPCALAIRCFIYFVLCAIDKCQMNVCIFVLIVVLPTSEWWEQECWRSDEAMNATMSHSFFLIFPIQQIDIISANRTSYEFNIEYLLSGARSLKAVDSIWWFFF